MIVGQEQTTPKRKGRGKALKPSLVCTSIRLDAEVLSFYRERFGSKMQAKMREVLREYSTKHVKE